MSMPSTSSSGLPQRRQVRDLLSHASRVCKIVGGVVVPPRADAVLSPTADTEPTQRDRHIQEIAGKGRMAWQRDSHYNQRAKVEGQIARWKQVLGDGLRFHSDETQATEVAIAAEVLNRMLDLGRPNSVRIA
jgi:hypothetical protein